MQGPLMAFNSARRLASPRLQSSVPLRFDGLCPCAGAQRADSGSCTVDPNGGAPLSDARVVHALVVRAEPSPLWHSDAKRRLIFVDGALVQEISVAVCFQRQGRVSLTKPAHSQVQLRPNLAVCYCLVCLWSFSCPLFE